MLCTLRYNCHKKSRQWPSPTYFFLFSNHMAALPPSLYCFFISRVLKVTLFFSMFILYGSLFLTPTAFSVILSLFLFYENNLFLFANANRNRNRTATIIIMLKFTETEKKKRFARIFSHLIFVVTGKNIRKLCRYVLRVWDTVFNISLEKYARGSILSYSIPTPVTKLK